MVTIHCTQQVWGMAMSSMYPIGEENTTIIMRILQYRHLFPAPVDRTSASASSLLMCIKAMFSCKMSDLGSHPCPGNWVTVGRRLCIMPGPHTHLVQELNAHTVPCWRILL